MTADSSRATPANIEAEQALLGAVLVNNAAFDKVSSILEPDHFFEPLHQKIYEVAGQMLANGRGVTPVTIKAHLPADATVGDMTLMQYVARLAAEAVNVVNARDFALAVHDAHIDRKALSALQDGMDAFYSRAPGQDPLEAFAPIEDRIAAIRAERIRGTFRKAGQSYIDTLSESFRRGKVDGVPIAINEIANVISEPCFETGNLYGLLSSSGEGKSSLTAQIMYDAVSRGYPTLFLSFDQSSDQTVRQMVAQVHEIEARRQRDAKLLSESEFSRCMDFAGRLDRMPFEIMKCHDQNAARLGGMARTFIKRHAGEGMTPLMVVDHIRAIKSDNDRADEGTKALRIGQTLKSVAGETGSAWLVLNQRNTQGMRRPNPRPIAADLFGGEGAKAPFDAIFYLYRFKKFHEEMKAVASRDSDWKQIEKVIPSAVRTDGEDIAEIGAIKVRFGTPYIREKMRFQGQFTRYVTLQEPMLQESLEGVF